jgi:hypothetical protein
MYFMSQELLLSHAWLRQQRDLKRGLYFHMFFYLLNDLCKVGLGLVSVFNSSNAKLGIEWRLGGGPNPSSYGISILALPV